MDTLIQLYTMCLVAIILYGTEIWSEKAIDGLEQLQYKCLKRLLKLPTSTPNMATLMEFGNLPIRTLVHRRQLGYYYKLKNSPSSLPGKILAKQEELQVNESHTWAYQMNSLLQKYNVTFDANTTKLAWKNQLRKPTRDVGESETLEKASQLSKMSRLLETKQVIRREEYLTTLPHYKATLIFKARCRMLNLKNNFRNGKGNLLCDLCHNDTEDDDHLLNACPELNTIRTNMNIHRDQLFRLETTNDELSNVADFLVQAEQKLRKL